MKPGRTILRFVTLLLGVVYFGASVLIRVAPAFMSVGSWRIYLKFYRPDLADWLQVPLAPVLLATLALLAGLAFITPSGRAFWYRLRTDSRKCYWVLGSFLVLGLTLLPPTHPPDNLYLAGQELATSVIFGSAGIAFLLFGLGRVLDPVGRLLDGAYQRLLNLRPGVFAGLAALWVFLLANLVSWLVFDHIPHVQDTVAQVFQAKLFAAGRLYLPSPPLPQFFDLMHVINDGRWYSQYPPGHPLLLALGVLIRAPWIVNPLLGALTVIVIYRLGRELYDEPTARLATLLASLSPFLVFMSSEFMNHSSALLFTCLFLLFFARTVRERSDTASPAILRAKRFCEPLLAGLSLGMVVLIRPFTALLIAVPFVVAALVILARSPQPAVLPPPAAYRLSPIANWLLMLAGGAAMTGVLLFYNWLTNGDPFKLGYTAMYGAGHTIGLGQGAFGETLTLGKALIETNLDLNGLNRFLFEFPIPSLLFITLLFAFGPRRRRDLLLLSTVVMLVAGYFFYFWHSTILFGPRWEYESFGALVLLSARGIRAIRNAECRIRNSAIDIPQSALADTRPLGHSTTWSLFILCYLSMFLVAVPALARKYRQGFSVSSSTLRTVRQAGLSNAVALSRDPEETALGNSLTLDGPVVYARDLGPLNPALQRQYPGRRFFFAHRDTLQELKDLNYESSALKQGLDSIVDFLRGNDLRGYRYLFFPLAELAGMAEPVARSAGLAIKDYRALDSELVSGNHGLENYLPALAVWVLDDPSTHIQLFGLMNGAENFQVGDARFTLLATSPNRAVVLYGIHRAR
jgi:hypothetical protein